jgi:hypothetical protein
MEAIKEDVEIEIKTILDRCIHIMQKYPRAKNSDKVLYVYYIREFYGWFTPEWMERIKDYSFVDWKTEFIDLPLFASITRLRAKAQNELKRCQANEGTRATRIDREQIFRELMSKNRRQADIEMYV